MIVWNKIDLDHYIGATERGDYHVVHIFGKPRQPWSVCFVPHDTAQKPQTLGARTTIANAQYCADLHHRLALMPEQGTA